MAISSSVQQILNTMCPGASKALLGDLLSSLETTAATVPGLASAVDSLSGTVSGLEYLRQYYVASVADLAALTALDASSLANGALVYVLEVEDLYFLLRDTAYVADAVAVVEAVGGGVWLASQHGRWDDVRGDVSQGAGNTSLTLEDYRDTAFRMYFMRHDQDDALSFSYQLPHSWNRGAVRPHVHVLPMSDPVAPQVAYFTAQYAWATATVPVPAASGWTTVNYSLTINPGSAFTEKFVDFGMITPPEGTPESAILLIRVVRSGTSPSDTYATNKTGGTGAANIGLLSFDVHFRKNKIGTVSEYPTANGLD